MLSPKICDRADECRASLCALLGGEYKGGVRWGTLLSSFDIVIEHHEAIIRLVRAGLFGSAFALVRVIVEAFYCGHWLACCASEIQRQMLIRNKGRFPKIKQMAEAIDRAMATGALYQGLLDENRWDAMCDYTHTGSRQLSRRSLGTRIQPNYSNEDALSIIAVSTAAILMFGRHIAIHGEHKPAADQIEEMIFAFESILK